MTAESNQNLAQSMLKEFLEVIARAREKLEDKNVRQQVLSDLGLKPNPNPLVLSDDTESSLKKLDEFTKKDNVDLQAFESAFEDILNVLNAIDIYFSSGGEPKEIVNSAVYNLLTNLTLAHVKENKPNVYWWARLIGFIQESFAPNFSESILSLGEVWDYLDKKGFFWEHSLVTIAGLLTYLKLGKVFFGWDPSPESKTPIADKISERSLSLLFSIPIEDAMVTNVQKILSGIQFPTNKNKLIEFAKENKNTISDPEPVIEILKKIPDSEYQNMINVEMALGKASTTINITLIPIPADEGGPALFISIGGSAPNFQQVLEGGWVLEANLASIDLIQMLLPLPFGDSTFQTLKPKISGLPISPSSSDMNFSLKRHLDKPLIMGPYGLHLELRDIEIIASMTVPPEGSDDIRYGTKVIAHNSSLVIDKKILDNFIAKEVPSNQIHVNFDLGIGWDSVRGMYLEGGNNLSTAIPINKKIGPMKIKDISLNIKPKSQDSSTFSIELSTSLDVTIGPVLISVQNIGIEYVLSSPETTHSGITIPKFNKKYPEGVGIMIKSDVVNGGGFLFRSEHRYAGVVQLKIGKYRFPSGLQAVAILDIDKDTGDISLFFSIFLDIEPPYQLGYGFKVSKIGGLIGFNRRISHSDIASGMQSGILDSIMFPENPVANAIRIIGDFNRVFPVQMSHHVFGPAIRIDWGPGKNSSIIKADLAIILGWEGELYDIFTKTREITILGRVTCRLPEKEPIIQINIGVLGLIDFSAQTAELYGSLYYSKILNYPLTGDMAMAVAWGSEKNFIFSVGGFNPKFTVPSNFPPFGAPTLKRLNLAFSSYVTFECYLALTSNTVQIGARVEAKFEKSGAKISGFLGFDALIQFNPLYYVIDVAGGFSVSFKGRSLTSITFSGFIEGPNPHRIVGSLTFSILWWDISIDVDKTFGDQLPEVVNLVNPWPLLKEALEQNDSWTADQPNWLIEGITIKESSSGVQGIQMIHPLGNLKVSQSVVPLNFTLTKFGSSTPIDNFRFEISSLNNIPASNLASTEDYFAPAQFAEYDNEQKLTLKSYDLMDSGVFVASTDKELLFSDKSMSTKEISYETIVWNDMANKEEPIEPERDRFNPSTKLSETFILAGSAYQTTISNNNQLKYKLNSRVKEHRKIKEKFVIIDEDDNKPVDSIKAFAIAVLKIPKFESEMSQASAMNMLRDYSLNNPQDKRNLKVVPSSELVEVIT